MSLGPDRARRFAALLARVEAELDWPRLERVYCDVEEGVPAHELLGFFGEEEREALRDASLRFAADLGERLREGGKSLYVGAGVAEIAPIAAERVILGRDVRIVTLAGPEAEELARAFGAACRAENVPAVRVDTRPLVSIAPFACDHVWFASVLTDPVEFPALHAALYERGRAPARAVRREEERARALLDAAFRALEPRGWVTTSDEEIPLVLDALAARGIEAHVPETGRLSPVVGDLLRHLSLSPRLPEAPPRGKLSGRSDRTRPPRSPRSRP